MRIISVLIIGCIFFTLPVLWGQPGSTQLFIQDFESTTTRTRVGANWNYTATGSAAGVYKVDKLTSVITGTLSPSSPVTFTSSDSIFIVSRNLLDNSNTPTWAQLTFNSVNLTTHQNVDLRLKLAAIHPAPSGPGIDQGDTVLVEISPDGGTTWHKQLSIRGGSDQKWDFNNSPNATVGYTTSGSFTRFNTNPSTIVVKNLPNTANVRVRITFRTDRADEYWQVDDIELVSNRYIIVVDSATQRRDTLLYGLAGANLNICQNGIYRIFCSNCSGTPTWTIPATGTNVLEPTGWTSPSAAAQVIVAFGGTTNISVTDPAASAFAITINTLTSPVAVIGVGGVSPAVQPIYFCPGESRTLQGSDCSACTGAVVGYSWQYGVTLIGAGASAPQATSKDHAYVATNSGHVIYTISATYPSAGDRVCFARTNAPIQILQAPTFTLTGDSSARVCPQRARTLSIDCPGCILGASVPTRTVSYEWLVGATSLGTAPTYTTQVTATVPSGGTAITYNAVVTYNYSNIDASNGTRVCSQTVPITVNYAATPQVNLMVAGNQSAAQAFCQGATLALGSNITLPNVQANQPVVNYTWAVGSTTIATGTSGSTSHSLTATGTYNLTLTNEIGCTATDATPVVVTMKPNPIFTIDRQNAGRCFGDTMSYLVNCSNCPDVSLLTGRLDRIVPTSTNPWDTDNGRNPLILCPACSGGFTTGLGNVRRYDIIVTYDGCATTDTARVTLDSDPNPSITSSAGTNMCLGTEPTLTVTTTAGSPTFMWNTAQTGSPVVVSPQLGANVYTVTATNTVCQKTATITITARDTPVVSLPSVGTRCIGSDITLTPTVNALAGATYLWDTLTSAITTQTLSFASMQTNKTARLAVTHTTSGINCTGRAELVIPVRDCGSARIDKFRFIGGVLTPVANDFACAGDTIRYRLAGLPGDRSILWSNGDTIDSLTIVIPFNTTSDTIINSVTVTQPDEVCRCEFSFFGFFFFYFPSFSYITGSCNGRYCYFPSFPVTRTVTRLVAQLSDTIIISRPRPQFLGTTPVCQDNPVPIEVRCPTCTGNNVVYTWNYAAATTLGGTSPFARDSVRIVNPASNLTITSDQNYTYIVTITDANTGCRSSDSFLLAVKPLPRVSINGGQDTAFYCTSSAVTLTANTLVCNNCSYLWTTNQTIQGITINTPNRYKVTVTERGCVQVDSIEVRPFPATTITLLNRGQVVPSPTRPNINLCVGQTEILTIDSSACVGCNITWNIGATTRDIVISNQGGFFANAVDPNGCLVASSPVLAVLAPSGYNSLATASPSQLCNGEPVVLSVAPCANCTYQWFVTPPDALIGSTRFDTVSTAGSYYAQVINPQGCRYPSNIVNVNNGGIASIPTITSTATTLCAGAMAVLRTTPVMGSQYQWFRNNQVISSATLDSLVTSDTGDFYVRVRYSNGCAVNSPVMRIDTASFNPPINPTGTATICGGSSVNLSTTFNSSWSYQWYRNGVAIAGATGASFSASTDGNYYVNIINQQGCTRPTSIVRVNTSAVSSAAAQVIPNQICSGDSALLSVSLCPNCLYNWYDAFTGIPLNNDTLFLANKFSYRVRNSGTYYALTRLGNCEVRSNNVSLVVDNPILPAINATSPFICNGVSSTLTTPACTNCNYTWLQNGLPVPNALNSPTFVATDTGWFRVRVQYQNGCASLSDSIRINSGRFNLNFRAQDSVICNNAGDTLSVGVNPICPSGLCIFEWYRNDVRQFSGLDTFYVADTAGIYKSRVIRSNGCWEESSLIVIDRIILNPTLTASSSDICGTQPVRLSVSSCPTCSYTWRRNGGTMSIPSSISSIDTIRTTGTYNVLVSRPKCAALSTTIILNPVPGLSIPIQSSDSVICANDTVTLSRTIGTCSNCVFQWLLNGSPIPAATVFNYSTNTPGTYRLQMRQLTNNCIDTSAPITINQVLPPVGFGLNLNPISPVTTSAPLIDLDAYITPPALAGTGLFSSVPFSGAAVPNQGLSGIRLDTFNASVAQSGFHRIVYTNTISGCPFEASNIIQVLEPAQVQIINQNPASVSYEACVSDSLRIIVSNLPHYVDSVLVLDRNNVYRRIGIGTNNLTMAIYAGDTVYNGFVSIQVPDFAKASYLQLRSGADSTLTPFVLIHNSDLSFAGLPNILCSNGNSVTLTGTPSGGSFSVRDSITNALVTGIITGNTLNPQAIPRASYNAQGRRSLRVIYQYPGFYTNGNACPQPDTVSILIQARAVFLDSVRFNRISASQTQEDLTDLIYRVYPHNASPTLWSSVSGRSFGFAGSFTSPAGAPLQFQPANAGVGRHPIQYIIRDSSCVATVQDSITVLPLPASIGLQNVMCWNQTPVNFGRQASTYPYVANPLTPIQSGRSFRDTFNLIRVTSAGGSVRTFTLNGNAGSEQYQFTPSSSTLNQVTLPGYPAGRDIFFLDTVTVEYIYRRVEYTGTPVPNVAFDSVEYVVASIRQPIMIEDTFAVSVDRALVKAIYCEEDRVFLFNGQPSGGNFFLQGGTGTYSTNTTLPNGLFNPFQIHNNESADINYRLSYVVTGLACQNQDTMTMMIPEPANPLFTTASGDSVYCFGEAPDQIVVNLQARDVSTWMIGGVAQPAAPYFVNPSLLAPGLHIGTHQIQNTFIAGVDTVVCVVSASDTFRINALPNPRFVNATNPAQPAFAPEYCTNDSAVLFVVQPTPSCQIPAGAGTTLVSADFESGMPSGWPRFNVSGNAWTHSNSFAYSGNGCAFVDSSMAVENSWLITPSVNMTAGRIYRIEYYVRTSPQFTGCAGACDDAALRVTIGNAGTVAGQTTTLAFFANLTNVNYELRSHDFLCTNTGTYHFGFQVQSGANRSRWLRLDDVRVADITSVGCTSGGLGSVVGTGTSIVQDSLYIFRPTQIAGGTTTRINYTYTDSNGCRDSVVQSLVIKAHPTVTFTNLNNYCANAPAVQVVPNLLGGTFTASWLSGSGTSNYNNVSSQVTPRNPGTERLEYLYIDPTTTCRNIWADTFTVFPILDTASITGLRNGFTNAYCQTNIGANPITVIDVAPRPLPPTLGTFRGPGVRITPGGPAFFADSAVIDAGRTGLMTITYVYTTQNGCVDSTQFTTRVQARPNLRFENFPDSICANANNVQIRVRNTMRIGWQGQTVVDSLIPVGAPNTFFTATGVSALGNLQPSPALVGFHPLTYNYADSFCTAVLQDTFRVDSVPVIRFQNLPSTRYLCENEPAILLLAYPPYFPGSGFLRLQDANGVIDSVTRSFYAIQPNVLATPAQGNRLIHITYQTRDLRGCVGTGRDSIEIRPYPRITFAMPNNGRFCSDDSLRINLRPFATPTGGRGIGRGFFTDDLPVTSIFQDTLLMLNQTGPRLITYNYLDSLTRCANDTSTIINIFNTPDVDFDVLGGCALDSIHFAITRNNMIAGVDSLTSVFWDFGDGATNLISPVSPATTVPDAYHVYVGNGNFQASLILNNQGLCLDTVRHTFIIAPTIQYNPNQPYVQTFDAGPGGWFAEQPQIPANGNTSIWSLSSLNGNRINDPSNIAWVTHSTAPYTYGQGQKAWVYTPCFDMTTAWRPMLTMDLWRDVSQGIDGAVMEYYDYTDNTWKVLGNNTRGIHWYQPDFLLSRPGNQTLANTPLPTGWTGISNGWEKARYRLDQFAGQDNLRMRIAFASADNTILQGFEGVAFDSVWIGERGRNVLVEHFTNLNYPDIDLIDYGIYGLIYNQDLGRDVNLIEYHIELDPSIVPLPQQDQFFAENSADPSVRRLLYGINEYAQAIVDGAPRGSGRSEDLTYQDLEYDMLQYPPFDIQIAPLNISGSNVQVDLQLNTLLPMDSSDYAIVVAITEDSLYFQRDPWTGVHKHAVLRKILPTPDGELYSRSWAPGNNLSLSYNWTMFSSINPNMVQAVAFIQNRNTEEVYQSATTRDLTIFAPTTTREEQEQPSLRNLTNFKLFPNPAMDYFNVQFDQALEGPYQWRVVDLLGRTLQTGEAQSGTEQLQIQTEAFSSGMYIFCIYNDKVYSQRQVIVRKP